MKHVIICKIKTNGGGPPKAMRLEHLEYVQRHQASILAAGPLLGAAGAPSMMLLVTHFTDREAAEDFIRHEPYTASGHVFESVEVHSWSQNLPELLPGSFAAEIDKERGTTCA